MLRENDNTLYLQNSDDRELQYRFNQIQLIRSQASLFGLSEILFIGGEKSRKGVTELSEASPNHPPNNTTANFTQFCFIEAQCYITSFLLLTDTSLKNIEQASPPIELCFFLQQTISASKVFIYLEDADSLSIDFFEHIRDKENCPAIYFNAEHFTSGITFNERVKNCLLKTHRLKSFETTEKANTVKHAHYILWANKHDRKSLLRDFPEEVARIISTLIYLSQNDSCHRRNSIFFKYPVTNDTALSTDMQ